MTCFILYSHSIDICGAQASTVVGCYHASQTGMALFSVHDVTNTSTIIVHGLVKQHTCFSIAGHY